MMYDAVRKIMESQYEDFCDIVERQKTGQKEHGVDIYKEVTTYHEQPCKLSYKMIKNNDAGDLTSSLKQEVEIFLSPDVTVNPGSKIIVTHVGLPAMTYANSGLPAVHPTHQEVILVPFRRWS